MDAWDEVVRDMAARRLVGLSRYGKPVLPADAAEDWLRHLYEELLDACVYVKAELLRRDAAREGAD